MKSLKEIENLSNTQRKNILKSVYDGNGGHIGGSFSIIDCLTYMYANVLKFDINKPEADCRDRLIFSKGHSCLALYWTLVEYGFFDKKILLNYGQNGAVLAGHPEVDKVPGIEISSGSLGHGPSIGVGVALSGKLQKKKFNTYVIVGDGETNEGSVWEAAMSASQLNLENYFLIVDNNGMESLDKTDNIMSIEPIDKKLQYFGFEVVKINGHNFNQIQKSFSFLINSDSKKPKAIILDTVKAFGVSFMQGDAKWHYRAPTQSEYEQALQELESK
jgi:transketolase